MSSSTVSARLYEILCLPHFSSIPEIRTAYKTLALKYHPDKNMGDARAVEKFKEVKEAYDTLSNEDRKKRYDAQLKVLLRNLNDRNGANRVRTAFTMRTSTPQRDNKARGPASASKPNSNPKPAASASASSTTTPTPSATNRRGNMGSASRRRPMPTASSTPSTSTRPSRNQTPMQTNTRDSSTHRKRSESPVAPPLPKAAKLPADERLRRFKASQKAEVERQLELKRQREAQQEERRRQRDEAEKDRERREQERWQRELEREEQNKRDAAAAKEEARKEFLQRNETLMNQWREQLHQSSFSTRQRNHPPQRRTASMSSTDRSSRSRRASETTPSRSPSKQSARHVRGGGSGAGYGGGLRGRGGEAAEDVDAALSTPRSTEPAARWRGTSDSPAVGEERQPLSMGEVHPQLYTRGRRRPHPTTNASSSPRSPGGTESLPSVGEEEEEGEGEGDAQRELERLRRAFQQAAATGVGRSRAIPSNAANRSHSPSQGGRIQGQRAVSPSCLSGAEAPRALRMEGGDHAAHRRGHRLSPASSRSRSLRSAASDHSRRSSVMSRESHTRAGNPLYTQHSLGQRHPPKTMSHNRRSGSQKARGGELGGGADEPPSPSGCSTPTSGTLRAPSISEAEREILKQHRERIRKAMAQQRQDAVAASAVANGATMTRSSSAGAGGKRAPSGRSTPRAGAATKRSGPPAPVESSHSEEDAEMEALLQKGEAQLAASHRHSGGVPVAGPSPKERDFEAEKGWMEEEEGVERTQLIMKEEQLAIRRVIRCFPQLFEEMPLDGSAACTLRSGHPAKLYFTNDPETSPVAEEEEKALFGRHIAGAEATPLTPGPTTSSSYPVQSATGLPHLLREEDFLDQTTRVQLRSLADAGSSERPSPRSTRATDLLDSSHSASTLRAHEMAHWMTEQRLLLRSEARCRFIIFRSRLDGIKTMHLLTRETLARTAEGELERRERKQLARRESRAFYVAKRREVERETRGKAAQRSPTPVVVATGAGNPESTGSSSCSSGHSNRAKPVIDETTPAQAAKSHPNSAPRENSTSNSGRGCRGSLPWETFAALQAAAVSHREQLEEEETEACLALLRQRAQERYAVYEAFFKKRYAP